jgi:Tetratricopeptide repeat
MQSRKSREYRHMLRDLHAASARSTAIGLAAELLRQILLDRPDMAPAWVWEALNDPGAIEVHRLDRLAYDAVTLHGPRWGVLCEVLVQSIAGDPERSAAWRVFLDSDEAGFRLSLVGIAVGSALVTQPGLSEEVRAAILNNLSVRCGEIGDDAGALLAIREAAEIHRRLAFGDPKHPQLAMTLNNLSGDLSEAGDSTGALAAAREAVAIRRRLKEENPADNASDLANSLANLSSRLHEAGDDRASIAAIREAAGYIVLWRYRIPRASNPLSRSPSTICPIGSAMR